MPHETPLLLHPDKIRVSSFYGLERTRKGKAKHHGFRSLAQRTAWIDEDPGSREPVGPYDPALLKAWESFSVILHERKRNAV